MTVDRVEQIREALKQVIDPELGINIVDLGLIYDIEEDDGIVDVTMTLTTPGCPLHDTIMNAVHTTLEREPGVTSAHVNVVWSPPWSPSLISDEGREMLRNR